MTFEVEFDRLKALRERHVEATGAVAKHRSTVADCIRETSELRVAAVLDPDATNAKDVEARIKALEKQRASAQSEIDRMVPELDAISTAIKQIEAEFAPRRHAQRVEKQAQIRVAYTEIATKLLEAANLFSDLNNQAKALFNKAVRDFPKEEILEGQPVIVTNSGLRPIWDESWIKYGNAGTRRDVIVSGVFNFDRTLVPETDPVARKKLHSEEHFRKERERHETAARLRNKPTAKDFVAAEAEARARNEDLIKAVHPLSDNGSWKPNLWRL